VAKRDELGRYSVGQPALLADLLHQPAAKAAAAEDVVDDARRIPIGIVPFGPHLAEGDGALRHRAPGDQQPAILGRLGLSHLSLGVAGG
jgi:hypothetical protein